MSAATTVPGPTTPARSIRSRSARYSCHGRVHHRMVGVTLDPLRLCSVVRAGPPGTAFARARGVHRRRPCRAGPGRRRAGPLRNAVQHSALCVRACACVRVCVCVCVCACECAALVCGPVRTGQPRCALQPFKFSFDLVRCEEAYRSCVVKYKYDGQYPHIANGMRMIFGDAGQAGRTAQITPSAASRTQRGIVSVYPCV